MLGINPERIEKDDAEIRRLDQDLSELMQLSQFVQGPAGGGAQAAAAGTSGQSGGGDPTTAEISAVGNPTAGLAGVGNT